MSRQASSTLEVKSGEWNGNYVQCDECHRFRMNLKFKDNRVTGRGIDEINLFSVEGKYKPNGEINFTKVYDRAHSVKYSGEISQNGSTIYGKYVVDGDEDSFTMSVDMGPSETSRNNLQYN